MSSRVKLIGAVLVAGTALLGGAVETAPAGLTPLVLPNVIFGTDGHDVLNATAGPDVIYAKSGNDTIRGVSHDDVVWASSGNDRVELTQLGAVNNVRLELNVGHDLVTGIGMHNSYVNGDSGNDRILMSAGGCGNQIAGGSGNDRYENVAFACAGDDLNMGNGHDVAIVGWIDDVALGNGNDRLSAQLVIQGAVAAGSGNDVIDVGFSQDTPYDLGSGHDRLSIDAAWSTPIWGGNGNDQISGQLHLSDVIGGSGNDRITLLALSAVNDLDGLSGRDHARLDSTSASTTCIRIELVTDLAGTRRPCS